MGTIEVGEVVPDAAGHEAAVFGEQRLHVTPPRGAAGGVLGGEAAGVDMRLQPGDLGEAGPGEDVVPVAVGVDRGRHGLIGGAAQLLDLLAAVEARVCDHDAIRRLDPPGAATGAEPLHAGAGLACREVGGEVERATRARQRRRVGQVMEVLRLVVQ